MNLFLVWAKYFCGHILLFILQMPIYSQSLKNIHIADSTFMVKIDSLHKLYGYNKTYPKEHELSILIALSYFPELDSTEIIFKKAKITTTLNARPTLLSLLFKPKSERKYIVRINKKPKDGQVFFEKVPFNAKIGLLGHEFNHFIDYQEKNILGVFMRLVSYGFLKSRATYEKQIDEMTIKRGLGWQLHDWSDYVLNESDADRYYKKMKRLVYLTPTEILFLIED